MKLNKWTAILILVLMHISCVVWSVVVMKTTKQNPNPIIIYKERPILEINAPEKEKIIPAPRPPTPPTPPTPPNRPGFPILDFR